MAVAVAERPKLRRSRDHRKDAVISNRGIHDPASDDPQSLSHTAREHLLRRIRMQGNPESALRHVEPRKQRPHPFEPRRRRSCGRYVKGAPVDQGVAGENGDVPADPDRDPGAASQKKAKIRTGEHATESGSGDPINPDPMPAGTHPCAEWVGATRKCEELTEWNVGWEGERRACNHVAG